jgi:hypothetical protein
LVSRFPEASKPETRKLARIFCRRRKIQCRPLPGDHLDSTCQLVLFSFKDQLDFVALILLAPYCAAMCEAMMTWHGQEKKRSHGDLGEALNVLNPSGGSQIPTSKQVR